MCVTQIINLFLRLLSKAVLRVVHKEKKVQTGFISLRQLVYDLVQR